MNRKKIITCSLILVCVGMVLLGILWNGNKVIYGLSEGRYTVEWAEDAVAPASIAFDFDQNTFSFTYDLLSSYLPRGTWRMEQGTVIATTDDQNHVYLFDILDNDTLAFIQEGSSTITYTGANRTTNPPIVDGTKFIFSDPR